MKKVILLVAIIGLQFVGVPSSDTTFTDNDTRGIVVNC